MNEENLREIQQIVEQANEGNWIPMALIGSVMLLVITLLVYIWNDKLKVNGEKHGHHESNISRLTETNAKMEVLLERLTVISSHHDEDIRDIKRKVEKVK